MSATISRRAFTAGGIATVLGGGTALSLPISRIAAQGGPDLTTLGLPTIDLTVTPSGYEGAPTELEAGRYLVTVTLGEGVEYGPAQFVGPPAGMTAEELYSSVFGEPGGTPEASPAVGPEEASPVSEEAEEEAFVLPTVVYQATFAGGAVRYAEQQQAWAGQAVIDLRPGEWILEPGDPEVALEPVFLTVTGEMPTDLPEPEADIDVTYIDFGIAFEGNLTAGDHILRIENQGAQPHFLVLEKGPDEMTNEQVGQLIDFFGAGGQGTPPDVGWEPDTDLIPLMDTAVQSIGIVNWVPVSLEAGTYAWFCFFPTAGEGPPPAFHGMPTGFTGG